MLTESALVRPRPGWRPRGRFALRRPTPALSLGLLGVAITIAVAETAVRLGMPGTEYLPAPTAVLWRAVRLVAEEEFLRATAGTLAVWGLGLTIATVIGGTLGLLLGSSRALYRLTDAAIELVRTIPGVALIPFMVLIFGLSPTARLWLVVYGSVWPIVYNTIYGVHNLHPGYRMAARSYGLNRLEIVGRVAVPNALPYLAGGIRIAASFALITAIASELFIGGGIGDFIQAALQSLDAETVYATAILAGVLGISINGLLVQVERRVLPWTRVNAGAAP